MNKKRNYYDKWDVAESKEVAFESVKTGVWSFERFEAWLSHTLVEYHRDNFSDESL